MTTTPIQPMGSTSQKTLLVELKEKVNKWKKYWERNADNWHKWRKFVYHSTLDKAAKDALSKLQKPAFEFNTIEAYLSRLCGEWAKQEPSFKVSRAPDAANVHPKIPEIVEGHLQAILQESKANSFEVEVYKDQMSGGYSAFEVFMDYESPYTFNQKPGIRRCYDPTMCGWDVIAQQKHKGDGEYCFEVIPMAIKEFNQMFPDAVLEKKGYNNLGAYSWTYRYSVENIVLLCKFYLKEHKRKRLFYLSDNTAMLETDYRKMCTQWKEEGRVELPPSVAYKRYTTVTEITRYLFSDTQILEEKKTDLNELPIIFVDGNSFFLRDEGQASDIIQYARCYFYHAIDTLKLKNIAGQTIANWLENLMTHKLMAPVEGVPANQMEPYLNQQKAATLLFNAFMPDGQTPIQPPILINQPPMPPEVMLTFTAADTAMQNILGSYDAALGINENQLAGVAIVEAATQSNAVAMPYVVNFMDALTQASKILVDQMAKKYFNPRPISIIDKMKKNVHVGINGYGQNSIPFKLPPNSLGIIVEAGVNFEVQKNRSVQLIAMLAQQFDSIKALINGPGLPILLDNLDFRGSDSLKSLAEAQIKKQQAQEQQQGQMPNPIQLEQQKMQMESQKSQTEAQLKLMDLQLRQKELEQDAQKDKMEFISDQQAHQVELSKVAGEHVVREKELHMEHRDMEHKHANELINTLHAISEAKENRTKDE